MLLKRVAAIDIGTNSVRLLVAERDGDRLKAVEAGLATTRLGEGIGSGMLLPQAMERTVDAVEGFCRTAMHLQAGRITVAATSAVRDALNRDEFVQMVRQRTGLKVRILSGEEEAALTYRGVLAGLPVEPRATAVVDVGGGSTELIWPREGGLRLVSVNVGAVRMTEAGMDVRKAAALLKPFLEEIKGMPVKCLVGVGGTVTTLAAVDQELAVYDPVRVHGYCLTAPKIEKILAKLEEMTVEERRRVPGLQPERADIIVAGVAIVKAVMEGTGAGRMLVSEYDILYGLVLEEVEIK
ncbi:MAG: Ppx/GppA family phosphatase [Pelotomaculum sp.]|nr:Ppx/GppA family phosphatase [Pelotomaculum sp.]